MSAILKTDPQVSESDISNLQGLIAATKDDEAYYIAAIAAATVNLASKTVAVAQQATAAGASTPTAGFSAGISLDIKGSQSDTSTTATKSNASNLTASNINIATDSTKDTSVTLSGSNINATDTLNINTHDLNVIASTDTATTNSSSNDISGSVSMTVYGAASGPQVSLGYGQNESRSSSTTHTNSTLTGNTVNIDVTNDATFKGATVRADEALTVNVGNNLEVASVQDTSSSSNHGMNISGGFGFGSDPAYSSSDKTTQGKLNQTVGLRTGDGTIASVNGGIGASNGRSYDTQTVVTSLTGDSVNITTGKNTKLSGSVIAATDNQGNDTGKLNLTTQTLTTENLTDTHYNSATGFSVGANIGLTPTAKDPKPDTKDAETPSGTKINSEHIAFNTSTDASVGKTLATVGEGNIAIGDTANSTNTTNLNRDVAKVDKELYSSSTGTKVDATIDNRMFTKKGQKEIAEDFKKTELLGEAVADVATKESVTLGDTFEHIENVNNNFDINKQMASVENGKYAQILNDPNATPEQKQPAIQVYAQIYSNMTGVTLSDALVIATNTFINAANHNQTTGSTIFINDEAQKNGLDYIGASTHEDTHAQINQGLLRDRGSALNEDYANLMQEYGKDNFAYAYNTSDYSTSNPLNYGESNNHVGNATSTLITANNQQLTTALKTDLDNVDFSLIPGAELIRWANTKGTTYSQINIQELKQDQRIYDLTAQKVASQGKEAIEMAKNLPSTLAFLIENPSELTKLPEGVQKAFKQFAADLHTRSNAISQGLASNDPKILEAQAQAESTLLANVTTTLIGAGIGKVAVEGGKVVVKETVKSAEKSLTLEGKAVGASGNPVEFVNVGSKGNWDKMINKDLKPNTAYQLDNGHTYITDAKGNVNYVEADLSKITMDRNGYQQSNTGKSGNTGDQGGHLIASSLGGAGDKINLVPMDKVLNNGTWKTMEANLAKALEKGKSVSVKIDVGYPAVGGVRPNSFTVNYTINGVPNTKRFYQ